MVALARHIDALEHAVAGGNEARALRLLKQAVPEFVSAHAPGDPVPERRRLALVVS